MLFGSDEIPTGFFAFHKDDLKHTFILGSTRNGMSNTINPFFHTKEEVDSTMKLLMQIHGGQIEECVEAKAREVLLAVSANKSDPCLLDIVEAFERAPELQEFAGRLRYCVLPGAIGATAMTVEDPPELPLHGR